MNAFVKYISTIFVAIKNLLIGLRVTWKELWAKKVTMQYPENRETLVISDRWRAELVMPHDDKNEHACTSCGICMTNCPNGTIKVVSKTIETPEGRKKKVLDKHLWDAGMCTYCNLCVLSCPSDAIQFTNDFEGAVFDREVLKHQLNKEGSQLREKKKVVRAKPKPKVEKTTEEKVEVVKEKATETEKKEVTPKEEKVTPNQDETTK